MARVIGNVAIDEVTGAETYTPSTGPNLSRELYEGRLEVEALPDPENKPGSVTTSAVEIGATEIEVATTLGLKVGSMLSIGKHTRKIVSKSENTLTLESGWPLALPVGTLVGYRGSDEEWAARTQPALVKAKQRIAALANADAAAIINHLDAVVIVVD